MFSFCLAFLSGNNNNKTRVIFLLQILKTYLMRESKNANNPEISIISPYRAQSFPPNLKLQANFNKCSAVSVFSNEFKFIHQQTFPCLSRQRIYNSFFGIQLSLFQRVLTQLLHSEMKSCILRIRPCDLKTQECASNLPLQFLVQPAGASSHETIILSTTH